MAPVQKTTALNLIVAKAVSHIGDQEVPRGSNSGPEVNRFLACVGLPSGNSWCAAFACFIVGNSLQAMGYRVTDSNLVLTGYVPSLVDHARSNGSLIAACDVAAGTAHIRPGYLMVEWIDTENGYHHTGIIEVVGQGGAFGTIEGNSNTDGGNEGYEVCRQRRSIHDVTDSGHPKYAFIATL